MSLVQQIGERLLARGEFLATAESCTGGLIAKLCTDIAGSSQWFERGVVSYSNHAKVDLLGVPAALLKQHGAVSEPVVRAMAEGLLQGSPAHWAIGVTGIAGPGGGSTDKPVGTVWMSWLHRGSATATLRQQFSGDREQVRQQTAEFALNRLLELLRA